MRASVFIATSLDGFIARENGSLDWLPPGGGEEHGYTAFMATVDAVVMGRNTFETVLTFDAWPFGEKPVVVLTTRPYKGPPPLNAVLEFMRGSPHEILRQLAERGLRHVYVDGGITVQRFLEAGLVQNLTITRIPVLLGRGIPLFGSLSHEIRLEHFVTRSYAGGMVTSEYEVVS
jgi:dihydrofolate reductase